MLVGSCVLLLVCCGLCGQRLFIPSLRRREEERKRELSGIGASLLSDDGMVSAATVDGLADGNTEEGQLDKRDIP